MLNASGESPEQSGSDARHVPATTLPTADIIRRLAEARDRQINESVAWLNIDVDPSVIQDFQRTNEPLPRDVEKAVRDELQKRRILVCKLHDPEYSTARRRLHDCGLLISPIRRVPSELIADILLRVQGGCAYHAFDVKEGPWKLAAVCQHWRAVVLSTSNFWVCPIIVVKNFRRPSSGTVLLLQEVFRRAREKPLHLMFLCFQYANGKDLFKVVLDRHLYWYQVTLAVSQPFLDALTVVPANGLPLLRDFRAMTGCPGSTLPPGVLLQAPQLRTVDLGDIDVTSGTDLPFGQLVGMSICNSRTNRQELNRILCMSTNIVVFDVIYNYNASGNNNGTLALNTSVVTHAVNRPSLRRLHITDPNTVQGLTAPLLLDLRIVTMHAVDNMRYHDLTSFIHRSKCNLTRLILYGLSLDPSLVDLLKLVPSVETLSISQVLWDRRTDEIVAWIVHAMQAVVRKRKRSSIAPDGTEYDATLTPPLLPRLRGLHLDFIARTSGRGAADPVCFINATFLRMVHFRMCMRTGLFAMPAVSMIDIHFGHAAKIDGIREGDLQALRLVKQGLGGSKLCILVLDPNVSGGQRRLV